MWDNILTFERWNWIPFVWPNENTIDRGRSIKEGHKKTYILYVIFTWRYLATPTSNNEVTGKRTTPCTVVKKSLKLISKSYFKRILPHRGHWIFWVSICCYWMIFLIDPIYHPLFLSHAKEDEIVLLFGFRTSTIFFLTVLRKWHLFDYGGRCCVSSFLRFCFEIMHVKCSRS